MFGTWIGLTRQGSGDSTWTWTNTQTESSNDLPFNPYTTYYQGSQLVGDGNCAMAARTTMYSGWYDETQIGYRAADCGTMAKALCMKPLV